MENLIAKPQLSFGEALKTAFGRLTDFNGRSRRSEFWWFMLVFYIGNYILSIFINLFLPNGMGSLVSLAIWFLAFGVTVRRLQDSGKSKWWVIISWLAQAIQALFIYINYEEFMAIAGSSNLTLMIDLLKSPFFMLPVTVNSITSIAIFIFCLLDSDKATNKYGPSTKYVETGLDADSLS